MYEFRSCPCNVFIQLNSLLVTRQMTLLHRGGGGVGLGRRNESLERTSEANLDTQSSDISAMKTESQGGHSIVWYPTPSLSFSEASRTVSGLTTGTRLVIPVPDSLGKEATFMTIYRLY